MKFKLLPVFLFTVGIAFGQNFEGTLTYVSKIEIDEKLAKMGTSNEGLKEKMIEEGSWSDTMKISYKEGDYYGIMNSREPTWMVYRADSNKIYSFHAGTDICSIIDASKDFEFETTGNKPTVQLLDTTVFLNGIKCSIVRIKWKSGEQECYFNSSQLKVNPDLYANHIYEGWAAYFENITFATIKNCQKYERDDDNNNDTNRN